MAEYYSDYLHYNTRSNLKAMMSRTELIFKPKRQALIISSKQNSYWGLKFRLSLCLTTYFLPMYQYHKRNSFPWYIYTFFAIIEFCRIFISVLMPIYSSFFVLQLTPDVYIFISSCIRLITLYPGYIFHASIPVYLLNVNTFISVYATAWVSLA